MVRASPISTHNRENLIHLLSFRITGERVGHQVHVVSVHSAQVCYDVVQSEQHISSDQIPHCI